MRHIDEDTITQAVIAGHAAAGDARLRELMTSLVQHLHAFAREVQLTETEWAAGLRFIAECANGDDDARQLALLSHALGLSTLVSALGRRRSRPSTASALPTVFQTHQGTARADATETCFVRGQLRSADGRPLAQAEIRAWPSGPAGQGGVDARACSGADGRFVLRCSLPQEQAVAQDGAVIRMLQALGRHPWRPAHLQFMISAPGHERLVAQVFRDGDRYLDSDALFGVRSAMVADWVRHAPGRTPDGAHSAQPFHTVDFDFVLNPTTGDTP